MPLPAIPRRLSHAILSLISILVLLQLISILARRKTGQTGIVSTEIHDEPKSNTVVLNTPLSSLLSSERHFYGFAVDTSCSLPDRVEQFNDALSKIRRLVLDENKRRKIAQGKLGDKEDWDDSVLTAKHTFIWGADDNYREELAAKHRHIITVVLPWIKTDSTKLAGSSRSGTKQWNSLTDKSNVVIQTYYKWTGDDQLCTWIETPGTIKMKYDSMFNFSCSRDIEEGASKPHSLQTLYFYNKPLYKFHYWPNDGKAYPAHYYTTPPPSVFYIHIHQDAVVSGNGDVFSGNTSLAMYVCRSYSSYPSSSLPANSRNAPYYEEIFSLGQMWVSATFHRAVEVIPRLAPYVSFMKANPNIMIQAGEGPEGRLGEVLKIFGLNPARLIAGTFRAKIVYQPRETGCGMASVQEAQLTARIYREYIAKNFPSARPRNRLILIRRTGHRAFTKHAAIETALIGLAAEFNLTFSPYYDSKLPSFNDTMAMFNAAVLVVGPHGAGLSNVMFSEPGTFVIEGVCNLPHVNLCFQRLAHVMGHRYHGIASKGGCEGHVDVPAEAVEQAARKYLTLYRDSSIESNKKSSA